MIRPAGVPPLASERFELRALVPPDAAAILRIQSDREAMRYWSTPPLRELAQAAAIVERARALAESGAALCWGVCERTGGPVLGTITLHRIDEQNDRAEVGYILDRASWGRGTMQEALGAVIAYAFGPMGLRRLEADTDPRNAPSVRLLERLGFRREGLLRERWIVAGEVCDTLFLGLLRSEWRGGAPGE